MEMSSKLGSRGRHSTMAAAVAVVAAPASAEPQLHRRRDGWDDALSMAGLGNDSAARGVTVVWAWELGSGPWRGFECRRGFGESDQIQSKWFLSGSRFSNGVDS